MTTGLLILVRTFLTNAYASVSDQFMLLPQWLRWALLALMAYLAWIVADALNDRAAVNDFKLKQKAEIAERELSAVKAGDKALKTYAKRVEEQNEEARRAAAGSADPLKSGLDSLR